MLLGCTVTILRSVNFEWGLSGVKGLSTHRGYLDTVLGILIKYTAIFLGHLDTFLLPTTCNLVILGYFVLLPAIGGNDFHPLTGKQFFLSGL